MLETDEVVTVGGTTEDNVENTISSPYPVPAEFVA
jgi:hypothetical protein